MKNYTGGQRFFVHKQKYGIFKCLNGHTVFTLRKVPTIVIAHTFCASRDTRISYCWCLLVQGYFCVVQNYAERAELSK